MYGPDRLKLRGRTTRVVSTFYPGNSSSKLLSQLLMIDILRCNTWSTRGLCNETTSQSDNHSWPPKQRCKKTRRNVCRCRSSLSWRQSLEPCVATSLISQHTGTNSPCTTLHDPPRSSISRIWAGLLCGDKQLDSTTIHNRNQRHRDLHNPKPSSPTLLTPWVRYSSAQQNSRNQ